MKVLDTIKKYIALSMEWICVVLVAALTTLAIISVIARYIFSRTFVQAEELITFMFVWLVFLGTVPVMYHHEHVSVAILQNSVPPMIQKIMAIFQGVVVVIVQCLLIYASRFWIATNFDFNTVATGIPYWTVYMVVPVSCALSGIIALIDLVETIINPWKPLGKYEEVNK